MNYGFHTILSMHMEDQGIKTSDIESMSHGRFLARTIRRWKTGQYVPSFENAADLMELLNYDISTEDLREALYNTKQLQTEYDQDKFDRASRTLTFRVRLDKLFEDKSEDEAKLLITKRMIELFGDTDHPAKYLEYLIRNDLSNNEGEE